MAIETFIPKSYCVGDWTIQNDCTTNNDLETQKQYAEEQIEISGATVNIFKLLGVHEQGKLIDLTGQGYPLSNGTSAGFDILNVYGNNNLTWQSSQVGLDVINTPAYIGYCFGIKKQNSGVSKYVKPVYNIQEISTIRIQQGANASNRASQIRIDRATGDLKYSVDFTGLGNGRIIGIQPGYFSIENTIMIFFISSISFEVVSANEGLIGTGYVNQPFATKDIRFTIENGTTPFDASDSFTVNLSLDWKRVDVVNLPDSDLLETIHFKQSVASPFWRIVPTMFNGGPGDAWEVVKLELIDYKATSLDNIQDTLFLENRDRDYSSSSIALKCNYQPFDSVGDLGKFGFSILDQYNFTCSFNRMVELLGRPIVIGDILELPSEMAYDHYLKPVKKYLEVTDAGWSAEGYTPQWIPIIYRFQANILVASQETRDIIKTPQEELYVVSDGTFFEGLEQVVTNQQVVSEANYAQAHNKAPETGEDLSSLDTKIEEWPSLSIPDKGAYVEDGLPPNGLPYGEGYKLPDPLSSSDGDYFRLNYEKDMNIPTRLYKFSASKGRWIYVETDRRFENSSHKPSVKNALVSLNKKSLQDKDL
jgi:hypothetical protein